MVPLRVLAGNLPQRLHVPAHGLSPGASRPAPCFSNSASTFSSFSSRAIARGVNGGYYDQNYVRHYGGINTLMSDGHAEYHKDDDLGFGSSCYQNKTKRYWWAFNVEQ